MWLPSWRFQLEGLSSSVGWDSFNFISFLWQLIQSTGYPQKIISSYQIGAIVLAVKWFKICSLLLIRREWRFACDWPWTFRVSVTWWKRKISVCLRKRCRIEPLDSSTDSDDSQDAGLPEPCLALFNHLNSNWPTMLTSRFCQAHYVRVKLFDTC